MAAPTPTARITPVGYKLPDGYRSVVTFATVPGIELWEKQITPPGFDGGEKIDTTTMHNITYRTADSRGLVSVTDGQFTAAYDPDAIDNVLGMINSLQSITFHYADGSSQCFWGFLQSFKPGALVEGQMPEATVMIAITNWDPNNKVEAGPVFTSSAGT